MMMEYPAAGVRKHWLTRLQGIEHRLQMQEAGQAEVIGIADEVLERENQSKTAAAHFLRCPLTRATVAALNDRAHLAMGVSHPDYA